MERERASPADGAAAHSEPERSTVSREGPTLAAESAPTARESAEPAASGAAAARRGAGASPMVSPGVDARSRLRRVRGEEASGDLPNDMACAASRLTPAPPPDRARLPSRCLRPPAAPAPPATRRPDGTTRARVMLLCAAAAIFILFSTILQADLWCYRGRAKLRVGLTATAAIAEDEWLVEATRRAILLEPLLPGPLACQNSSLAVNPPMVLEYDVHAMTDGAGAQMQRVLAMYQLSYSLGLGFLHQPLKEIGYQGLQALESNKSDLTLHRRWVEAFPLPSHHTHDCSSDPRVVPDNCTHVGDGCIVISSLRRHAERACASGRPLVVHALFGHCILDKQPELARAPRSALRPMLPWLRNTHRKPGTVRVAVHVRRGELFVVDSFRMLPNSYYVAVCQLLARVFDDLGVPSYVFEIYTEQVRGDVTITPGHHGIHNRTRKDIVLRPSDSHLEDFDVVAPRRMMVNLDPLETLQRLATADILVMSRSSFSFVAASLHDPGYGLVVYHHFWHAAAAEWFVVATGNGDIVPDELNYGRMKERVRQRMEDGFEPQTPIPAMMAGRVQLS
jgi:hypothetical protein